MISGKTTLIAHLGFPTFAFKAPLIYNPWFDKNGIDAVVVPMGVKAEEYPEFFRYLFKLTNIRGALVTMPHKVTTIVVGRRDHPDREGRRRGQRRAAARGRVVAGRPVRRRRASCAGCSARGSTSQGKKVLVVGNGGVGSPIAASLAAAGVGAISLFDPYPAASEGLADRLREAYPELRSPPAPRIRPGTTSSSTPRPLGMKDDDPLPMDVDRIDPGTFVGEVVMKQEITPFLREAQDKGCPIQVGKDMLFEQIPAYLEFFGFGTATPDELRAVSQVEE